jgi:hypothetical protein
LKVPCSPLVDPSGTLLYGLLIYTNTAENPQTLVVVDDPLVLLDYRSHQHYMPGSQTGKNEVDLFLIETREPWCNKLKLPRRSGRRRVESAGTAANRRGSPRVSVTLRQRSRGSGNPPSQEPRCCIRTGSMDITGLMCSIYTRQCRRNGKIRGSIGCPCTGRRR